MLEAKTARPSWRTGTSQGWVIAFALAAIAGATPGSAQSACTIIDALPTTITAPGQYCLDKDFVVATHGVFIQASNVVLDCRDHSIESSGGAPGVGGSVGASNLTVRNCRLSGFGVGIEITEDALVEDNQIGESGSVGIIVGKRALIRRNRVLDTGSPVNNPSSVSRGIVVFSDSEVADNFVSRVFVGAIPRNAMGILSMGGINPAVLGGNLIRRNVVRDMQGTGAHAILGAARDIIRDNEVVNITQSSVAGVFAPGALCRDNDIVGFTGPSGCSATSGNVLLP